MPSTRQNRRAIDDLYEARTELVAAHTRARNLSQRISRQRMTIAGFSAAVVIAIYLLPAVQRLSELGQLFVAALSLVTGVSFLAVAWRSHAATRETIDAELERSAKILEEIDRELYGYGMTVHRSK